MLSENRILSNGLCESIASPGSAVTLPHLCHLLPPRGYLRNSEGEVFLTTKSSWGEPLDEVVTRGNFGFSLDDAGVPVSNLLRGNQK